MFNLLHLVFSCLPWAAGAARPTMQLEHFAPQTTPVVEQLRLELHKLCQDRTSAYFRNTASARRARKDALTKLENALNSSVEAFPALAEACNCSKSIIRRDVAKRPLSIALKMYTNETLPLLDALLGDKSVSVRRFASRNLATSIPKMCPSVAELLKRMLSDSDVGIREEAAKALIQAVNDLDKDALQLVHKAQGDTDELVRERAASTIAVALRKWGRDAMQLVHDAILDLFEGVRLIFARSGLDAAVECFGSKALWMFEGLLGDPSTDVRNAAAEILAAKIKNKSKAGITIWQDTINISKCHVKMTTYYESERGPLCQIAATAAGKPLAAAVETLGRDAMPFLSMALSRKEPDVREMAAGKPLFLTIMPMKLEDARALVAPLMNDTDEAVRASVGQAAAWVEKLEVQRQATKLKEAESKLKEIARESKLKEMLAVKAKIIAKNAEADAKKQAERASKAEAEAVEQAKLASKERANAVEQAKFAQKQKELAYDNLQESEIAKIKAESNIDARRKTQNNLDEKRKEYEEATLSLVKQKIELDEKDKLAQEQKEAAKEYKTLAIGACVSAAVAILPLLARGCFLNPPSAPSQQNAG